MLNVEYFVDEIKSVWDNLKRSFYLFSIVDFDPSGWIIRDAFLKDLRFYGIKAFRCVNLIHPDLLKTEPVNEVLLARYPVRAGPDMEKKNREWLEAVSKEQYANMKYLIEQQPRGNPKLYGLEAESISTKRVTQELETVMKPILVGDEAHLKLLEMKNLNEAVKELIIFKLTHPDAPPAASQANRRPPTPSPRAAATLALRARPRRRPRMAAAGRHHFLAPPRAALRPRRFHA